MKKQNGFTVAELVVSLAVMALILGGIVSIFGTSMRSLVMGHNQAEVYAEARDVMNDLKTTLRYANATDIDDSQLANGLLIYNGAKVQDLTKGIAASDNEDFYRAIKWSADKKQIYIFKSKDNYTKNTPDVTFPRNARNEAFAESEYLEVYKNIDSTVTAERPFPILKKVFEGEEMYNIVLPIKYSAMGITKVDVLQSRVSPADPKKVAEIGGGSSSSEGSTANYLLEAVSKQFAKNSEPGLSKDDMVSKIDSGSLKTSGQAGATNSVNDYLKQHQTSAGDSYFDLIKNRSWTIVPLNGGGERVKSYTATKYWAIYIAKNVEDDIIYNSDGSITKGYYNQLINYSSLKSLATDQGRYIIRGDWNFLVYHGVYNVNGTLITDKKIIDKLDATETLGYATGVKTGKNRIIDYATWTTNYNDLWTTLDQRIDYNKTGQELTKATAEKANKSYYYPASSIFNKE